MCSCFKPSPVVYKKKPEEATIVSQLVRVVHAGGRIEMYKTAIPASKLIQKYPDMCITRPDVFNNPYESLLSANDMLLPGYKYYLIRWTTIHKLKHRHSRRSSQTAAKEPIQDACFEESICSAKDFFVSDDSFIQKRCVKEKKPFVPPIQRPRIWKEPEWEPGLTSIQELSP